MSVSRDGARLAGRHQLVGRVEDLVRKTSDRGHLHRSSELVSALRAVIAAAGRFREGAELLFDRLPLQREPDDVERDVDPGGFQLISRLLGIPFAALFAIGK